MKQFVLIDHSLRNLGGHYYTYASCVLPAAERAGYSCVLATHRDFAEFDALPASWRAYAIFRRKSEAQRLLTGAGSTQPFGALWRRIRTRWRAREIARISSGFAADCAALFEQVELREGDHVFIATASELDLLGLADFLERRPQHRSVSWHLQFHLGIFSGRDPDYAQQVVNREMMRSVFRSALDRIRDHRVFLYCTTEQLAAQYERLDVSRFDALPYPVHPLFSERTRTRPDGEPVRIACLGHTRREKGYRQLPALVRSLWDDYLKTGRAQLLLQTRRRDLRRPLDKVVAALGARTAAAPVTYAEFPLPLQDYAELVRSTDIGLLLYDGARYYARCSGVLLEMLCAGVPVIVPAGSWLSEQIAEENQRYLEALANAPDVIRRAHGPALQWLSDAAAATAHGESIVIAGEAGATFELALPKETTSLLLRFRWRERRTAGTYIRITVDHIDADGARIASGCAIEGARSSGGFTHALFHTPPATRRVRVNLRNAWDRAPISINAVECLLLSGERRPAGAIGLAAVDAEDTVRLIHDVLRHLDHYRKAAAAYATRCAEQHSADLIVAQITTNAHERIRGNTAAASH